MKKIILTLGIAVASFLTIQAQDQQDTEVQQQQDTTMGEGIEQIDPSELPAEVNEGIQNSDYQDATVTQAYKLTGAPLARVLGDESISIYSSASTPEALYLLQVSDEKKEKRSALYFTEDGKLYASEDMDM